jgi:rubrerythrin
MWGKMTEITTRRELIQSLRNSISVEESAKNSYDGDIKIIEDKFIVEKIKKIRNDEIKHIGIINVLISGLEKNEKNQGFSRRKA